MRRIRGILDRFRGNDQKCLFLRSILDYLELVRQVNDRLLNVFKSPFNLCLPLFFSCLNTVSPVALGLDVNITNLLDVYAPP